MDLEVVVYRSDRRRDTYVYLPVGEPFENLPETFRTQFGAASSFLRFHLNANKVLAQAEAKNVLRAISEQGFYLQLPPTVADDLPV